MNKDVKGFRVKNAVFPEGTEKLETHEECNHCNEPLFFAFRKSDLHPVLACAMCGRLYLSKATVELLARAKNELKLSEDEKKSLFSLHLNKNSNENSQTTRKNVELHREGTPDFGFEEKNRVDKKTLQTFTELNAGWQSASHFLSSQAKSTHYKRYQDEKGSKNSDEDHSSFYELNFPIEETETRTRVFDALLSVNEVYSGQCWVTQLNQTLTFRARPSVEKDLVKIILQIVGQLCGFTLQYGYEPNYELLKENPAHLTNLLAVLKHLGQKWSKTSPEARESHAECVYSELLTHFLWDQVNASNSINAPV